MLKNVESQPSGIIQNIHFTYFGNHIHRGNPRQGTYKESHPKKITGVESLNVYNLSVCNYNRGSTTGYDRCFYRCCPSQRLPSSCERGNWVLCIQIYRITVSYRLINVTAIANCVLFIQIHRITVSNHLINISAKYKLSPLHTNTSHHSMGVCL